MRHKVRRGSDHASAFPASVLLLPVPVVRLAEENTLSVRCAAACDAGCDGAFVDEVLVEGVRGGGRGTVHLVVEGQLGHEAGVWVGERTGTADQGECG